MLAVMTAIAAILAARILLLLSGVGAFALAYLALGDPTVGKLGVLVIYVVGVVLPVAYLYVRGNHHGEITGS